MFDGSTSTSLARRHHEEDCFLWGLVLRYPNRVRSCTTSSGFKLKLSSRILEQLSHESCLEPALGQRLHRLVTPFPGHREAPFPTKAL